MFEPSSFDDFGEMVSSLRFGRAFMVKAPEDRALRRRLVDFLAGAAAASDADFERISADMYALTWGNDPEALRDMVDRLLEAEKAETADPGPVLGGGDQTSPFGRPVVGS